MKGNKTVTRYKKQFNKLLRENAYVSTNPTKGKPKSIQLNPATINRKWVQCYSKKDTPRREYPKYLFISNDEYLVSLANGKPVLLMPESGDKNSNRKKYRFYDSNGVKRAQSSYTIMSICFGSRRIGKADKLMQKYGLEAFRKSLVHAHHIKGFNPDKPARPEDLEIVTNEAHTVIHKMPEQPCDTETDISYMKELAKIADAENPDKVTVVLQDMKKGALDMKVCNMEHPDIQTMQKLLLPDYTVVGNRLYPGTGYTMTGIRLHPQTEETISAAQQVIDYYNSTGEEIPTGRTYTTPNGTEYTITVIGK